MEKTKKFGPWQFYQNTFAFCDTGENLTTIGVATTDGHVIISTCVDHDDLDDDIKLMAVAPELLEIVREFLSCEESRDKWLNLTKFAAARNKAAALLKRIDGEG